VGVQETVQSATDYIKERQDELVGNTLQRFVFENSDIRGEIVSLDSSWQSVLKRRAYPPAIRTLLGEITAATILLSATIKIDGTLAIQFKGKSKLQLLISETTNSCTFRAMAKWKNNDEINQKDTHLLNNGVLAVTITPRESGQPYQGLVEVGEKSIQEAVENYMEKSEQLTTRLWLASDDQKIAGILLQKLPKTYDAESEAWNRITTLASTITDEELLTLNPKNILRRLFHEETIRIFEEQKIDFSCSCSEERTEQMLQSLGEMEARSILAEQDSVDITCEFCGKKYIYSSSGVDRIFSNRSGETIQKPSDAVN
jgi:molecular chaperone Hsp33